MRVIDVSVTMVEVPQTAPLAPYRSHLRSSSTTQSGIVRIDVDDGLTGWGEYNVNFLPGLSGRRAEQAAREWILGRDPLNLSVFHRDCPPRACGGACFRWRSQPRASCTGIATFSPS